ncbi:Tetratricopeptide repeat protein [Legionella rubrilucens]|uniref:Tetratricopeptide repeat protein n=1 Tax=Legionella rubrilucens TaxID=458 RepID=A0A0W0XS72_9GAMM|nr:tetratricopeptide repeat protein [Legionella rubrilucens]KTD47279.1 Tetratricopeptide repeat protein [Legionella rubrilucens]
MKQKKSKTRAFFYYIPISFLMLLCNPSVAEEKYLAPLFDNLGTFHHKIETKNLMAQRYFNQGLVLLYSFEFGESIRAFQAAVKIDPNCAMCYWGLALALGSKTDMPLNGYELKDAKAAIYTAMEKVDKGNFAEKLYISALSQRYTDSSPQKMDEFAGLCSSYSAVTGNNAKKYVDAMKKATLFLPNDADAKTLYAAALFDLAGWDFWKQDGRPNPLTLETIQVLEAAIKQDAENPGANHLYVHIMESSPNAKKALTNAERLSQLVPGSEHLAHMPCHIFYTLGLYHKASLANINAIKIYKEYAENCKKQGFEPEIQYLYYHNYDYLVAASSMEGREKLSIETADEQAKKIVPWVEKNPALQKNLTNQYLMRIRFGKWQELLNMPKPDTKLQYALGIWYFAQGVSALKLNHSPEAKEHLNALNKIIQQGANPASLGEFGIGLLHIAHYILDGLIQYQIHDNKKAFHDFSQAVKLQDTFLSSDPPSWYFPTRQLLGSFLLKTHQFQQAREVFLEDLKKHPDNGWSLYGLAQSLIKSGKIKEAKAVNERFQESWNYSDLDHPISLLD